MRSSVAKSSHKMQLGSRTGPDPVSYLRGRVLLSVHEKFHIESLDDDQAVCLKVPDIVVG